jgi:hypothetical protein
MLASVVHCLSTDHVLLFTIVEWISESVNTIKEKQWIVNQFFGRGAAVHFFAARSILADNATQK